MCQGSPARCPWKPEQPAPTLLEFITLVSCTLNPKGATVFLGPLQFYTGGPLPVPQVPTMGSGHRGSDQIVSLPPTPLLAPVPTDLGPR